MWKPRRTRGEQGREDHSWEEKRPTPWERSRQRSGVRGSLWKCCIQALQSNERICQGDYGSLYNAGCHSEGLSVDGWQGLPPFLSDWLLLKPQKTEGVTMAGFRMGSLSTFNRLLTKKKQKKHTHTTVFHHPRKIMAWNIFLTFYFFPIQPDKSFWILAPWILFWI